MFRDATSQAMTTDAFCDACLLEKKCYADELWQHFFVNFAPCFWTPKRGLKNGPKNANMLCKKYT